MHTSRLKDSTMGLGGANADAATSNDDDLFDLYIYIIHCSQRLLCCLSAIALLFLVDIYIYI